MGFADFWPGFRRTDNWFLDLLSKHYDITVTDEPDYLIFSAFGNEHRRYDCTRIFYTAENSRPNFDDCDYAFSYDFLEDTRNYRLPSYVFYADAEELTRTKPPIERILAEKRHFCCMLVSNPKCQERNRFFHQLAKYKPVHSGGLHLNNIGGPVPRRVKGKSGKVEFIRNFKFVIAFENASYPGYTTEKVFEPMLVHSIPIYWGNPWVHRDFNTRSFVNCHEYADFEQTIERIIAIDTNEAEYRAVMEQPYFVGNNLPECVRKENILKQFHRIFSAARKRSLRRSISAHMHRAGGPLKLAASVEWRHVSHPLRSAESLWLLAKPFLNRGIQRVAHGKGSEVRPWQRDSCWCGGKLHWVLWPRYSACADCRCYVNRQPTLPHARRELPDSQANAHSWLSLIARYDPQQGRVIAGDFPPGLLLAELERRGYECVSGHARKDRSLTSGLPPCGLFLALEAAAYTSDPLDFWKEVARLLMPGGIALLQAAMEIPGWEKALRLTLDFFQPAEHPFIYTRESLLKLSSLAGLEMVAVEEAVEAPGGICVLRKPL